MSFKELTFKKKLEHIWEYYKFFILGGLFILFVAYCMVDALILNPRPDTYVGVAVYDQYINPEQLEEMEQEMDSLLSLPEDKTVRFTTYYFDENDDLFNVDMQQKFVTYLYTLETQLICGYRAAFENFVASGYIAPLTDYYTEEELSTLEDRLIYLPDPEGGEEKPYGISLYDSRFFTDYSTFDMSAQPAYIGIFPVADYEEASVRTMDALISE